MLLVMMALPLIDNATIVALVAELERGEIGRVRHHESAAEVVIRKLRPARATQIAPDGGRGGGIRAKAKPGHAVAPGAVVEVRGAPGRALIRSIVEIAPGGAERNERRRGGVLEQQPCRAGELGRSEEH